LLFLPHFAHVLSGFSDLSDILVSLPDFSDLSDLSGFFVVGLTYDQSLELVFESFLSAKGINKDKLSPDDWQKAKTNLNFAEHQEVFRRAAELFRVCGIAGTAAPVSSLPPGLQAAAAASTGTVAGATQSIVYQDFDKVWAEAQQVWNNMNDSWLSLPGHDKYLKKVRHF
jgi:hypothetical protein